MQNVPESLQLFDTIYASVLGGMSVQYNLFLKNPNEIGSFVRSASEIAHQAVVERYKRLNKAPEDNDGVDYLV
jgi:hypothetical protein